MSAPDPVDAAMDFFRRAARTERLAHAYLVEGNPAGASESFATQAAACLLCEASAGQPCGECVSCKRVVRHTHPDYFRIEPEKKSRVIDVKAIRDMNRNLQQTSYMGGWKVACIRFADRLNDAAANAFLKTLEEPPPRTQILLLSDSLDAILPTIRSRCQRIHIGEPTGKRTTTWSAALGELLGASPKQDALGALLLARRFHNLIEQERARIAAEEQAQAKDESVDDDVFDARVEAKLKQVRRDILAALQLWQRDLLLLVNGCDETQIHHADCLPALKEQAAQLTVAAALRRVRAAAELSSRLDRLARAEVTACESAFQLLYG